MIERPVILLTFANQQNADYLPYLEQESKRLNDILSTHHDKGTIEVYREESITVEKLSAAMNRFDERIVFFHYGGHADGGSLRFVQGDANAAGLGELLGQLPNLKVVFLNGCATQDQVQFFLDNGVPAVIATAVPINDERAGIFAENFYRTLSNHHSVESAFKRAVAIMKTIYGGSFDATIVRSGEQAIHGDQQQMPWGLYLNKEPEEVLNWELPVFYTSKVHNTHTVSQEEFKVNMYLEEVIDSMIEHKPELEQLCYNEDGELDSRAVLLQIIQNFPWPMGTQVRLLVAKDGKMDTPSIERLKQIISVYTMTSQFLFYVVMSQMWDEKRAASFNTKSYLVDMLYLNKKQFGQFDYFRNFIEAIKLLKEANCDLYIPELTDLATRFDEHGELYEAYDYLESIRSAIYAERLDDLNAKAFEKCVDGEYYLSTILIELAFMIKYDLVTIRDIHVINFRSLETEFNHFIKRVNVTVGNIAVSEANKKIRARAYPSFTHNSSVILTADLNDPSTFLNLSPFIIDKNAFQDGLTEDRATEQQLFMYAHRGEGDDPDRDYQYYATFHNIYIAKSKVSDQFSINTVTNASEEATQGRGGRSRSRRRRRATTQAEVINPYTVLKEQFKNLENDLIS